MTGTAKWLIVGSVVIIAISVLVALGFFAWMMFGGSMMSGVNTPWSMSLNSELGLGGMGSWRGIMGDTGFGGQGMMDSSGYGMMSGRNSGGSFFGETFQSDDFTLEIVEERLTDFLDGREDLVVDEIMLFDNHAYAQVIEVVSGIGAMEVLVDPVTFSVSPEHGPNMMWNLKYGGMHSGGMMGFSLGGNDTGVMTITPDQAITYAQTYLDRNAEGMTADDHADPFYGYYTIHTLHDGEVVGMLSVHGYSGDVFPHTWHGNLLEMSEDHHG